MSKILTIIITLFIFSLQDIYGQSGFTALYTFLWILAVISTFLTVTTIWLLFRDRKIINGTTSVNRSIDMIERESALTRLIDAFKELAKEDKKVARVLRQYNFL